MSLGKLNYIEDLRSIWKHEEREFTPWLAENISLLGEVLGIDLEVISVEHNVGAFSLDILAKDTGNSNIIAIENQLEITDHSHLGQIITYASGVEAKTIVWISKEVREEHRNAVDWLNQITNKDLEFFAVEIQIIQIDNSSPAPFFKVKASPNDWSKVQKSKVKSSSRITERMQFYYDFFTAFMEIVHTEIPGLTNSRNVGYENWKAFPTGSSGVVFSVVFRTSNRFSIEIYIDTGVKDRNKEIFDNLLSKKESIENFLGELSWERLDNRRASRIAINIDYTNNKDMYSWGIRTLKNFIDCFKPLLKDL